MTGLAATVVVFAWAYGFLSGFNDGGNLLASFTAGRVISPRVALLLLLPAALGPLLLGTAVARTIGVSVIDLPGQGPAGFALIVTASLAVVLISWSVRTPTSVTLALVGAMVGWAVVGGWGGVHWEGVVRVLVGMPVSVLGGGVLAWVLYRGLRLVGGPRPHAAVLEMARGQFVTAALQAFAYGANDMEKTIGLVVVANGLTGLNRSLTFSDGSALAAAFLSFLAGTLVGGWRLARRVGFGVYRVRPTQAASQQLAAAAMVSALALAGAPVSTTQTIDGALVGVGAALRASGIRWSLVREMLSAWLVTFPLAMLLAALLHVVAAAAHVPGLPR